MKIENPDTFGSRAVAGGVPAVCSLEAEVEDRNQEHFKTDHLLSNLTKHTISSGAITILAQAAKFVLTLVSTITLARLLTPRDFGLVAMATTVTGFLRVFKDAGLSIATVQRERITQAQVSNLFWINVAVSVVCGLIVAASAPAIAWFYRNPALVGVTLLLSTTFLISGSTVQHQALLRRQMRFKALAVIEAGSMVVGVLIGILMALLGYRYWSLAGSSVSMETTGFLLTWYLSRWRPQLPTRRSGIGPLVSFGANRTASSFISSLVAGSDGLLIGRFYGPMALGLYSRAAALLTRPLDQFLAPINAAFMPALCRLQSQPARYRSTFLQLYETVVVMGFLFTGIFLALARPVVLVLLGPKWEQAAVIFGGFTIGALCAPIINACFWLFDSQARGRDLLVTQLVSCCVTFTSYIAGLPFGPAGVAIAISIASLFVRLPMYYYFCGRRGPVTTADLWMGFLRHLPLWAVVFLVTWLTRVQVANWAPFAQLLICAPAGALAGATLICTFRPQRQVATQLLRTLRELKKNR